MSKNFEILNEIESQNGHAAALRLASFDGVRETALEPAAESLNVSLRTNAEIGKLAQRLFLSGADNKIVLFCGIDHPAACSWLCARTAENVASQVSGTVCLVNASSGTLSYDPQNSDLETDAPIATEQISQKLWRVVEGSFYSGINLTARAEALRTRLFYLGEKFSYVLIDASPICSENDTALLAQLASGVVLVAEANRTRRAAGLKAKQVLESVNARLLGVVLNNRTFPIPERLYRKL